MREFDICFMAQLSDFQLIVMPTKALDPVKKTLSPWPGEPMWFTPIDVVVERQMVETPLPNQSVKTLAPSIRVLYPAPFTALQTHRHFGIIEVDGEWLVETNAYGQFSESVAGWRRELAPYSWESETFADESALEVAFRKAASDCPRIDWLTETRLANEARIRAGQMPAQTDSGN